MRILKVLFCLLLFGAMAAAQESSSSSATPTTDPNTQQPGAAQQNPLQEPPKPSEVEAAKSAEAAKSKPSTFEVKTNGGADQDLAEVRLMTRHTEVNGDQTRSFRVDGENNLGEFNYFFDRRFLVTRRIQVLSMYRGTDDRSIDPEHNSLQKAYMRIYGPQDEYLLGDALVNFSRLSFNQNIKGFNGTWKFSPAWKFSTAEGVFIDRYGSLYKDLPGRPYLSIVSGIRLEHKMFRESTLGFNFSSSSDMVDSLPPAAAGTPPFPANNRVGTIDTRLQFLGVRVEGEYAWSFTNFDTRDDSGCITGCDSRSPQPSLGTQDDWAARLEGSWRHHKLSVRGAYLRFQPNFASINARQIADLQDASVRVGYDLTDWLTADGTLRRSNDNLRNQLPYETRLLGPEARFTIHDLGFYRRAALEFGYRHRDVESSDGSIDRFVRIPFAELTLPYHTTFFSIGYERRQAIDLLAPAQTSNTNRVYLGLRGMYELAGWRVSPNMRFELERQAQRPGLQDPLPDFTLGYDSNRIATAALFIEAPRWFLTELAYRNSYASLTGNAGYNRPSYRAALTYKFRNDENLLFIFSFERNNNFYLTSPNFDERIVGVTLVYKFARPGR
jgi:hypothetical protein